MDGGKWDYGETCGGEGYVQCASEAAERGEEGRNELKNAEKSAENMEIAEFLKLLSFFLENSGY